jgi:hypothetical protein
LMAKPRASADNIMATGQTAWVKSFTVSYS